MIQAGKSVIIENKKILLIQRGKNCHFPLMWAGPGGRLNLNERPEEAAARETKEEIGLSFEPGELFLQSMLDPHVEIFYYMGKHEGEINPDKNEINNWGWFSYEQAMQLPLAYHYPEILKTLKKTGKL